MSERLMEQMNSQMSAIAAMTERMESQYSNTRLVLMLFSELSKFCVFHGTAFCNQYVCPRNTRTEMCVGSVACCPLASHVEYVPRALLLLEKRRDRQTGARPSQYVYL